MGYLYVKVIETKKVAVKSSFFINYPFIRLRVAKEKRDTNFKPGVEWWDKIYNFKDILPGSNLTLIAQARDKSIHVFGSDWLGEVTIKLAGLLDGNVHQQWFKLGKGSKNHTRSPRGYLHLAFHYFDSHPNGKRPFSVAPLEPVMLFEDWLATTGDQNDSFYSTNTSSINPTKSSQESDRLRRSAPVDQRSSSVSSGSRKVPLSSKSKSTTTIGDTRPRANTLPARSLSEDDSDSSYEESEPVVPTGNLIDLSIFDEPKKSNDNTSQASSGIDIFNKVSPVRFSPKPVTNHPTNVPRAAVTPTDVFEKLNQDPAFDAWYNAPKDAKVSYNPKNPFLSMHESQAPAFTVQN